MPKCLSFYIMQVCLNCGGSIEFSEMQNSLEDGKCNSCQNAKKPLLPILITLSAKEKVLVTFGSYWKKQFLMSKRLPPQ